MKIKFSKEMGKYESLILKVKNVFKLGQITQYQTIFSSQIRINHAKAEMKNEGKMQMNALMINCARKLIFFDLFKQSQYCAIISQ